MIITSDSNPIYRLKQYLPSSISHALSRLDKTVLDRISEIRLHSGGVVYVTVESKNYMLSNSGISKSAKPAIHISNEEIEDFIYKFCKGSVYSHEDTLSEFYLTGDSVRVGISGEAIYKNGKLQSVGRVSGVNIRIPRHIPGCSDALIKHIEYEGFPDGRGILIISPPGVGKTTVLRDLAQKLSCPLSDYPEHRARRVCVIDERREIYMDKVFSQCCIDFLSGVDKLKGLEIAARVLSPEIIICDEIASVSEAERITRQKNSGIIFIASMHADNYEDLMKKDYINAMFESGVFSTVFALKRIENRIETNIINYSKND